MLGSPLPRRSLAISTLATLILFALNLPANAQTPAKEQIEVDAESTTYDLRIDRQKDEPILVDITSKLAGSITATIQGNKTRKKTERTQTYTLVDQYTKIDESSNNYEMYRYYGKDLSKSDGKISDSCLNGTMIQYTLENGQISLKTAEGRLFDVKLQGRLLTEYQWVGGWFNLPENMGIDQNCTVDLLPFLHTLTDADGELVLEKSQFQLKSVDEEKQLALLIGEVEWKEIAGDEDMTGGVDFVAASELKIDLKNRRLHSLNLLGTARAHGAMKSGAGGFEGSLKFSAEVSTKVGAPAKRALKAKPTFRDVPRTVRYAGATLSLPSHWAETIDEPKNALIGYTRTLAPGNPVIQIQRIRIGDIELNELMKQTEASMRAQGQSPVLKKVKSPIAAGFSTELEQNGLLIHTEFYQMNSMDWLAYKLITSTEFPKVGRKEYDKARKTLRLITSG